MNHLSAEKRYPECFEITSSVIKKLTKWIDEGDLNPPDNAINVVLLSIAVRAFNLYRSINNLLKTDHWEDAGILSRSMLELLLNLEEIKRDKKSEGHKSKKFIRFCKLQEFLNDKNMSDYHYNTGRAGEEEHEGYKKLYEGAKNIFAEFKSKRSHSYFHSSWCGKSVFALANESSNKMRKSHYEISYSYFSYFSHSGPLSAMSTMMLNVSNEDVELLRNKLHQKEKESTLLVMSLSTVWLLEIIMKCQEIIPKYDNKWNQEIIAKFHTLYGEVNEGSALES